MSYLQSQLALIGGLQGPELILILVVILIFFGAKKLPELAKGLGQGIKEFKKATKDVQQDLHQAMEEDAATSMPPRKVSDSQPSATDLASHPESEASPAPAKSNQAEG